MAASEALLKRALDFVTLTPAPAIEALGGTRASHFKKITGAMEDDNVVAVGISEKLVEGRVAGELTVCFYVKKKLAPSRITGFRMIPGVINMPGDRAVFTDVKELGKLRPEVEMLQAKKLALQSGYSIGHHKITAGTLGAIVRKGGKYFVLSNSHVLANSGKGIIGDAILYPGHADGGTMATSAAATLSEFIAFDTSGDQVNRVDAAIAEMNSTFLEKMNISIYKAKSPLKTIAAKRGMKVTKSGRTTGKTTGEVLDVNFRFVITYPGVGKVGFIDQVLCSRYTEPGDSGSIIVDVASGRIVGMHFAGANNGSVFNHIADVQKALGFQFVSTKP